MSGQHLDYDTIAATYNRRFANQRPGGEEAALQALVMESQARRVLEVGCGTAHWLAKLQAPAPGLAFQRYGLDLSRGMLEQARQRGAALRLVHGQAEHLPLADGCCDLVYCVNAIHHFFEPRAFIHEARRLLRPGGRLAVIGMDPRGHERDWYIYQYFPGTFESELARFPSWGRLVDLIVEAGFAQISLRLVRHIHDPKFGSAVLGDPFLEKHACSQLALLSEAAYAQGLERIRLALAAAEARGEQLVFANDIYLHLLVASQPGDDHA